MGVRQFYVVLIFSLLFLHQMALLYPIQLHTPNKYFRHDYSVLKAIEFLSNHLKDEPSPLFVGTLRIAEVLWSKRERSWAEAEPRLRAFRCQLAERGVAAAGVSGSHVWGTCDF